MGRCFDYQHILKDEVLKNKVQKIFAIIQTQGLFNNYLMNIEDFEGTDTLTYTDNDTGVVFRSSNIESKDVSRIEITINHDNGIFNVLGIFAKITEEIEGKKYQIHESYYDGERYFAKEEENDTYAKIVRRIDRYGACYEFSEDEFKYVGTLKSKRSATIDEKGVVFNETTHKGETMKWFDFENQFGVNESVHITEFKNRDRLVKNLYLGFTGREFESTKYISNEVEIFTQTKYKFKDEIVEVFESNNSTFCKIYVKDVDGNYDCYYQDNNKYAIYKVSGDLKPMYFTAVDHKFTNHREDTEDVIYVKDLYGIPTKVTKKVEE